MTDSIKKQDPIQEDPLLLAIAEIRKICKESNGGSQCFSFGAHGYYDGARHFLESSSETPRIAVQPGNVANLAQIMKVLARHNVLFAVKGGGHTTNPLFSSTMDVQIYMCRLNDLEYNKDAKTVTVGAGCVWDEVYHEMAKRGRNVVGGDREGGVGIAGYLTGGGYSLKTNQYGLGIDNITKIEVVLPSGEVKVVSEGPLFEALKGGGNNFGIVTQYTLKTHKQGKTWGGSYSFKARKEGPVKAAIVDFITKEKRKEAAMVAAFRYTLDTSGEVKYTISLFCVFDGPEPADDPWQRFEVIQPRIPSKNNPAGWKRLKERDNYQDILAMAELNHIVLADVPPTTVDSEAKIKWALLSKHDARGRFGCIMVKTYTKKLIDAIADETERASEDMKAHKGKLVVMDVWPFLPSIFANSPPAAWPHKQDENFSPLLAYFLWEDKSEDDFWRGRMQTALDNVKKVAIAEHCFADNAPVYCNTSLEDTKVKDIYRDNLEALSALRLTYDPENVMGRTGGFKIPLPKSSSAPSVTLKRFNVEGYYSYFEAGADNGFMAFPLEYDTSTSKVRATSSDSAGYFTVSGSFDGKDLRFTKQYSTWAWQYVGTATLLGEDEDLYDVAGVWGNDGVQHGLFAIKLLGVGRGGARKVSSAVRLEGEWSGTYTQGATESPTSLYLTVDGSKLGGSGKDGASPFGISGSFTDTSVTIIKTDTTSTSRVYSGAVDPSGALMRGTWEYSLKDGDERRDGGKFELMKGRSIAPAQAENFLLKNEDDLSEPLGDGFAKLFEEGISFLADEVAKLFEF